MLTFPPGSVRLAISHLTDGAGSLGIALRNVMSLSGRADTALGLPERLAMAGKRPFTEVGTASAALRQLLAYFAVLLDTKRSDSAGGD